MNTNPTADVPAPEYVIAQVQEALARDPRTSELGIHVRVAGPAVFLSGAVASAEHGEAVVTVAREVVTGFEVRDDLTVSPWDEGGEEEALR